MKRYWLRIAAGALGIFLVGMVIVGAGRRGVDHVKMAVEQSLRGLPGVVPFQVDNRRIGTITDVQMDARARGDLPRIRLTVELDSAAAATGLKDCALIAANHRSLAGSEGLHCSAGAVPDSMVEMGTVTFEPSGEVLQLYIPSAELAGNSWFRHDRVTQVGAAQKPGSRFSFQANDAGAVILIKDDKGRAVFQLNADSQGAFIQVRDSNGSEVVRFRADSQGVEGAVN
jgi:hypothetical protein